MPTKKPVILDANNQPANLQSGDYLRSDSLGSGGAGGGLFVLLDNNTFAAPPSGNLVYSNISVPAGNTNASSTGDVAFASTYSIPSNAPIAGTVLRIKAWGIYSTAAVDIVKTLVFKIKIGAITYLTGTISPTTLSISNQQWEIDAVITFFSIGASGTVDSQANAHIELTANTGFILSMQNTSTQTIDTTVSNAITITTAWGTNSASNSITLRNLQVYIENLSTSSNAGTFLQIANNLSDANVITARTNLIPELKLINGDQTTTSNTAQNVTELVTPILTANKRYRLFGKIHEGCNNTGGVKWAIVVPAGATLAISHFGPLIPGSSNNAGTTTTANATLNTTAYNTSNSSNGWIWIEGEVLMGNTAGTIQFQIASGVNGQLSTVYQLGTIIQYYQLVA